MAKPEIRAGPEELDPLWYKSAIIYEVPVRAFFDSNADGVGDFRGLTQMHGGDLQFSLVLGTVGHREQPAIWPAPWSTMVMRRM